ncbi:MAG: tellurite resistance TerB family protein [Caulobacterales bacterium]
MTNSLDLIFQATPPKERAEFDLGALTEKFRSTMVTDWTIPQAFLCLLLSAAVADGNFSQEERVEVQSLCLRSRALKAIGVNALAQVNAEVAQRLKERPKGLQEACESLPADLRLPVFAHCVDIILSDGELLQPEAEFLTKVTGYLGIPIAEAQRVMEVLLIKNRF